MNKKDIYIEALEYGKAHLLDGVNHKDFREHMVSLGYDLDDKNSQLHLNDIFKKIFGSSVGGDHHRIDKYHMNMDAYFSYIEHQELVEARASANKATIIAIGAIILSLITSFYSILQSSKPASIAENQFKIIESLKYDSSNLEKLLKDSSKSSNSNHAKTIKVLEEALKEIKSNKAFKRDAGKASRPLT
jgi:hypothetical protein